MKIIPKELLKLAKEKVKNMGYNVKYFAGKDCLELTSKHDNIISHVPIENLIEIGFKMDCVCYFNSLVSMRFSLK